MRGQCRFREAVSRGTWGWHCKEIGIGRGFESWGVRQVNRGVEKGACINIYAVNVPYCRMLESTAMASIWDMIWFGW